MPNSRFPCQRSSMSQYSARDKWLARFSEALADGTFVKLTLASYRGGDTALKNVFARPVDLKELHRYLQPQWTQRLIVRV